MANKDFNRLKLLLVEKKQTGKWLAEQLGKDQTTISKWCTNKSQPDVESLIKISKLLKVNIGDILIIE
jgi:transcriptional regulator with XRE-family HTH domain|uniref:helix-turn-helix transcriptional regulator n=1 Tax=Alloprevotella sp. TaxID=1872471 RepID=UPI00402A450E